jgi:hypothetical protein
MLPLYKPEDFKRVLETALLVAGDPLPLAELKKLFDEEFDDDTWRSLLDDLRRDWAERGVELVQLSSGLALPEPAGIPVLHRSPEERKAAEVFARRDGNPGHHRLSAAGDARRHRGCARRRRVAEYPQDA